MYLLVLFITVELTWMYGGGAHCGERVIWSRGLIVLFKSGSRSRESHMDLYSSGVETAFTKARVQHGFF